MRLAIALLLAVAPLAVAQEPAIAPRFRDPAAFAIEAVAGSLGSLAGIAIVGMNKKCGVEDLGCLITKVGAAGATGALGATLATYGAARYTGSPRSLAGAALGSVIGTGVGLGVHWLLNRSSDRNFDSPKHVVPIFAISQGLVSALGSRMLGK